MFIGDPKGTTSPLSTSIGSAELCSRRRVPAPGPLGVERGVLARLGRGEGLGGGEGGAVVGGQLITMSAGQHPATRR